jgi:hypothetical protein
MLKQQLEILSLFEDCTREINTLEIYKTIEPKYYDVLDKLIKEGYLEYKKDNYLKMTGFGLSKFENQDNYKLKLKKLTKEDLRYLFSKVKYVEVSLLELSFGKELIALLRADNEFTFKKFKLDRGGKRFSFKDTFNIYGEYDLLIVPNDTNVEYEFVFLTPLEGESQPPMISPDKVKEPVTKIKELSDQIAKASEDDSVKVEGQVRRGPWAIAITVVIVVILIILMILTDGGY